MYSCCCVHNVYSCPHAPSTCLLFVHVTDTVFHDCRRCSPECADCVDNSRTCTSCHVGYDLDTNRCVVHCHDNEYRDAHGRCLPCHVTCATCYGGDSGHCTRCGGSRFYQNGSCVLQCSVGFYEELSSDGYLCRQYVKPATRVVCNIVILLINMHVYKNVTRCMLYVCRHAHTHVLEYLCCNFYIHVRKRMTTWPHTKTSSDTYMYVHGHFCLHLWPSKPILLIVK